MEQTDQFYQELPFTLQQQHYDSEYVIFGTGLQQSALAAYLTKMEGKKVLVFDQQKTYGSCLKTITLKQLFNLTTNKLQQRLYQFYVPDKYQQLNLNYQKQCLQKKSFRGFNIDIEPSVFFGNSITCQSLKQADMDKYMDFRLVNHLLKFDKGKLQQVPLSKGKIFESKNLSLMQKKTLLMSLHTLIKLYQKHLNIQQDQNSTKQFDKGFGQVSQDTYVYFNQHLQQNCVGLLQKITKKNKKIMDFIIYIVCNYQYNYRNQLPSYVKDSYKVKNFISRFGKFINSCGIYGQSPYLYVDNGMGDIPQAFSRIASIFGGTFILHPKITIDSIQQDENKVTIKSNIVPGRQLKVKQVFYGQTFEKLYAEKNKQIVLQKQYIYRLLVLCKKLGIQQDCPSLGYLVDCEQFDNPVNLFMFDDFTHSCPSGYILYQFSTILGKSYQTESVNKEYNIDKKTQCLMNKLDQIRGKQFNCSVVYLSSYIRQSNVEYGDKKNQVNNEKQEKQQQKKQQQVNKMNCMIQQPIMDRQVFLRGYGGLELDYHFDSFIDIVGKRDNYFRKKNPYQNDEEQDSDEQNKNNILDRLDSYEFVNRNRQNNSEQTNNKQSKQSNDNINNCQQDSMNNCQQNKRQVDERQQQVDERKQQQDKKEIQINNIINQN